VWRATQEGQRVSWLNLVLLFCTAYRPLSVAASPFRKICQINLDRKRQIWPAHKCGLHYVSQSTGENVFRILLIALLAFGVWKGYEKYQSQRPAQQFQEIDISSGSSRRNRSIDLTPKFQCDGRTHCSQMTSCEEATFFLKNCPGTKMDGNNDGVPCEQQWCK
jgi:hypothetical protein